ncbi:phosphoribosyltransferase [Niastella vici]|uniref:Phosphoribosyltransferase n=1 Tax=Niastella vici TaxID=1703345 RepID=A0A1V9FZP7_9BACT|nr:phosphoribosyltransferase family protein [Niastella vici]OQP63845.1 phosphoribosyltransferase [Niastella vici]
MFADRKEAALLLANALEKYKGEKVIVLGIPRGGAETAYYAAHFLNAEFSLLIVRKLGHPRDPEYAFGAMAEDGTVYYNPFAEIELSQEAIDTVEEQQQKEIERRKQIFRKGQPLPEIKNKTVIIVDDGIATGATIIAAIKMCQKKEAGKIVVAAPVASERIEKELLKEADEVVILETPAFFHAVSQAYESFCNLTDQQALAFMERWEKEKNIVKP